MPMKGKGILVYVVPIVYCKAHIGGEECTWSCNKSWQDAWCQHNLVLGEIQTFCDQALIDHYAMSCGHLETNGLVEIVTMQTTKKLGEVTISIFYKQFK